MKTKISAAIDMLRELHQAQHIRDEGNVKYQAALAELESALAQPEPAPLPEAVASAQYVQSIDGRLAGIETKLDAALAPAPAV